MFLWDSAPTFMRVFDREERSGSGHKKGKVVVVVVGNLTHFQKIDKNRQESTGIDKN